MQCKLLNKHTDRKVKMTTQTSTPIITTFPSAQMPSMVLNIQSVSKQYNKKNWGSRDFTLELGPGVLGLLGPNGAGKSTLMRILATITKARPARSPGMERISPNHQMSCGPCWGICRRISACIPT